MPTPNHRTERLQAMLNLEEKRTTLQKQLDGIHEQLSSFKDQLFETASSAVGTLAKASRITAGGRKKRTPRGALKVSILAALEAAGHAGVRVTELAAALGAKTANLHSWFHTTARRNPRIVKIGGGHYRLNGGGKARPQKSKASAKPGANVKRTKSGGTKRGALAAKILHELQAAGKEGVSVKDLATKLDAKYRNISIWFATTGKKNSKIKKVRPAHYRLVA